MGDGNKILWITFRTDNLKWSFLVKDVGMIITTKAKLMILGVSGSNAIFI